LTKPACIMCRMPAFGRRTTCLSNDSLEYVVRPHWGQ